MTPLRRVALAEGYRDRVAVREPGVSFTYDDLLARSAGTATELLDGRRDLDGERVAILVPPSFDWVAGSWGIWRAGGVAVPLCLAHPPSELEYVLADSETASVVCSHEWISTIGPVARRLGCRLVPTKGIEVGTGQERLPEVRSQRRAMIVYTSGSTGRPKGVVTTHDNLDRQVEALVEAWAWQREDRILNVLPLHHVHGIVNVVACALWAGASCDMLPSFEAEAVWSRFAASEAPSLFMAVPTIYVRLIASWESAGSERRRRWSAAARALRLMVSGSAPLPVSVLERWREITGQQILERYGMTEAGMILSNPLRGERRPGFVGQPLPGVEVRLRAEDGGVSPTRGEIEVRGPGVFLEYWNRPEETREAFGGDWFRTGDAAVVEDGSYRLEGRLNTDILKTGGYKVSALEIEEALRTHPRVVDCAVVGLPDEEWGQRVAAAVIWDEAPPLTLEELRSWAKEHLAPYKVPTRLLSLAALPRNALGKVTKPALVDIFQKGGTA